MIQSLRWQHTSVIKFLNIKKCLLPLSFIFAVGCNSHQASAPVVSESAGRHVAEISPGLDKKTFKLQCVEAQFVKLLNIYRNSKGLNSLRVSQSGVVTARWHAQDMINKNYFSHTEPDGRTFYDRAATFGYPSHAENIAAGNETADAVFCQWKNSSGHNTNMLGTQHESTGIGRVAGGGQYGVYWSNGFGSATADEISEPLTNDSICMIPVNLPNCG